MPIFTYRGHLRPNSPLFRGRSTELCQLSRLWQGPINAYGIVYGGRRTGKTSLLLRLAQMVHSPLYTCLLDCQEWSDVSASDVYSHIAQRIAHALPGAIQVHVHDGTSLIEFLCQALSPVSIDRLVLLIDEIGALPTETRNSLANVLRSTFTQRDTVYPALAKLLVIVVGGVELHDLAVTKVSPFHNICEEIYLPDLCQPDAISIISDGLSSLGVPTDQGQMLGQAVYAYVQGHPYLTQRLGAFLEDAHGASESLMPSHVDGAVVQVRRDDTLLRHIYSGLHELHLIDTARMVLNRPVRFNRIVDNLSRLELLGLIQDAANGYWRIRNPLLEQALREWLDEVDPAVLQGTVAVRDSDIHGSEIIAAKRRRLHALEMQRAQFGILTPPYITMEIEDLQREIAALES